MKNRFFIGILLSHLAVIVSLLTPIIRVDEERLGISGNGITDVRYFNIIDYMTKDIHRLTGVLMIILAVFHILAILNALYGLFFKGYHHASIKYTFVLAFASATMGALQLYSQSYVFFAICAVSFLLVSFCSIRLMKLEDENEK